MENNAVTLKIAYTFVCSIRGDLCVCFNRRHAWDAACLVLRECDLLRSTIARKNKCWLHFHSTQYERERKRVKWSQPRNIYRLNFFSLLYSFLSCARAPHIRSMFYPCSVRGHTTDTVEKKKGQELKWCVRIKCVFGHIFSVFICFSYRCNARDVRMHVCM